MSEGQFDRTPPHNVEAEKAVLGRMMHPDAYDAVAEAETLLKRGDFYRPVHGLLFATICDLAAEKQPTDPIAVAEALDPKDLVRVGGAPYLHTLYASGYVAGNVGYYAAMVAKKARLRKLMEIGARLTQGVLNADANDSDPEELMDWARDSLVAVENSMSAGEGPIRWGDLMQQVCDAVEEAGQLPDGAVPGVPTGFADLDRLIKGFRPGQLVVVAARTSMGKSVAAAGFAQTAACFHRMPALVFNLEMPAVELGTRFMAAGSRVPLHTLTSGTASDDDWTRMARYMGDTGDAPLYVDSTANVTLADIRARSRKLHRQVGLRLIVVDYLQLVEAARAESRQIAVAAISRGLKLLAMELQVPVIAVAQLNRGPEQRADKIPTKADLRESGAIENDADVIIFLHRDDYYDKESARAGEADFIIAKNRNGPTDTITVAAQLHLSRFVDMAII
ncbi:replicative DNA helicase [Micromonospora wenchangensis]|uniref:replicative DNA helicase n=1 Tax=Micromonospora wenchangensis TaxID=1185415 RepID=UPI00382DC901